MSNPVSRGRTTEDLIEADTAQVGWVDVIAEYNQLAQGDELSDVGRQFHEKYEEVIWQHVDRQKNELEDAGLSTREAQVKTLTAIGLTHAATALLLDIQKNTVDEYARRVKAKRESAQTLLSTLDNVEEYASEFS
jgi:DNA-binding CsgD family transcriptional regulator